MSGNLFRRYIRLMHQLDETYVIANESGGVPAYMLDVVEQWMNEPTSASFPILPVIAYVRSCGKYFLPAVALRRLAQAKLNLQTEGPMALEAETASGLLETVLDQHESRYDYESYTATRRLRLNESGLVEGSASLRARRDVVVSVLLYDLMYFESRSSHVGYWQMPVGKPEAALASKRRHLALKAMPALGARGALSDGVVADALSTDEGSASITILATMVPVYCIHDEHMFIRVLQCFEATFQYMAWEIETAIQAVLDHNLEGAAASVQEAEAALIEVAPLFSLLATMRASAFRTFRAFTEGASAIQSYNYKRFEAACGRPAETRARSAAFQATPRLQALVEAATPSLQQVVGELAVSGKEVESLQRLRESMSSLEATHQRWKQTHVSLARRMIGQQTGTGYTAGTPYLEAAHRDNRLFASQ